LKKYTLENQVTPHVLLSVILQLPLPAH